MHAWSECRGARGRGEKGAGAARDHERRAHLALGLEKERRQALHDSWFALGPGRGKHSSSRTQHSLPTCQCSTPWVVWGVCVWLCALALTCRAGVHTRGGGDQVQCRRPQDGSTMGSLSTQAHTHAARTQEGNCQHNSLRRFCCACPPLTTQTKLAGLTPYHRAMTVLPGKVQETKREPQQRRR